jgi:hypothetical protein
MTDSFDLLATRVVPGVAERVFWCGRLETVDRVTFRRPKRREHPDPDLR